MKALLEPDPCRRPLAEMAFRAPWFDSTMAPTVFTTPRARQNRHNNPTFKFRKLVLGYIQKLIRSSSIHHLGDELEVTANVGLTCPSRAASRAVSRRRRRARSRSSRRRRRAGSAWTAPPVGSTASARGPENFLLRKKRKRRRKTMNTYINTSGSNPSRVQF